MFQYAESIHGGTLAFRNGKHVGWILTTTNNKWTFQLRTERGDEPVFDTQELAKEALEKRVEESFSEPEKTS